MSKAPFNGAAIANGRHRSGTCIMKLYKPNSLRALWSSSFFVFLQTNQSQFIRTHVTFLNAAHYVVIKRTLAFSR